MVLALPKSITMSVGSVVQMPTFKALLLDRDGTLIKDKGHLTKVEEVEILPGVAEKIAYANSLRIPIVVVTNQSVVGRGMCTNEDVQAVNLYLSEELAKQGAYLDFFVWCPHVPEDNCYCRKPKPGLLYRVANKLKLDLRECLFIGNGVEDRKAATACRCPFVKVGKGGLAEWDCLPEKR